MSAAQASQDVLASAAQSAVGSVSKLADNVKLGALALGPDDSDAQVIMTSSFQLYSLDRFCKRFSFICLGEKHSVLTSS